MRSLTSASPQPATLATTVRLIAYLAGLVLLVFLMLPAQLQAAPTATTWYVDDDGSNDSSCGSAALPCQQISAAIDKSQPGDTIMIAAGLYAENVDILHNLILVGAGAGATVIDGSALDPVVAIGQNATNPVVSISGVTLQNGFRAQGGGVYVESGQVTIAASVIADNHAQSGAGLYNQGVLRLNNSQVLANVGTQTGGGLLNLGQATLSGVQFVSNEAPSGGGLYNTTAVTLTSSSLSNNTATANGGAVHNTGRLIDMGTTVLDNQADLNGGGLYNAPTGFMTLAGSNILSNTSAVGGGLYNEGRIDLSDIAVADNRATGGNGGGIYNVGGSNPFSIVGGTIERNQASNSGGGFYNEGQATLTGLNLLDNVANNSGGGLYSFSGQLTLNQSNFTGNRAQTGVGGGLFNNTVAQLTAVNVQANTASSGGGIRNEAAGNLTLMQGQVYGNTADTIGGGIYNLGGTLTLVASAVYTNTATQGASGIYNTTNGNATLTNVTVSQNTANLGGALASDSGTVRINNSTISHNKAPGLSISGGSAIVSNTIVALNTGGANCAGGIVSGGHNLDSGTSCGLTATGDITGTDPLLGDLQNNGGSTPTRSLAFNSRAVDGGNNATCAATDQRGITRPQGDKCDIGAYEVLGFSNSVGGIIPANGCLTSTTTVNNSFAIGSLQLGVNLNFIPRGHLRIKFYSPAGRIISVLGATGGFAQDLDVLWDDESTNGPVGTEDHSMTGGIYKYVRVPDSPLSPLNGQNIHGTWKLEICNTGIASGFLNRWTIVILDMDNFKVFLPLVRRS